MDKIRAVIFRKNLKPEISIIEKDVDILESIVGGNIEITELFGDICLIHNESVDFQDLFIHNYIVAAVNKDYDLCSLTDSQLQYVLSAIANPKNQKLSSIN